MADKPSIAVHKFSSCDGCQLAFLNLGEDLLALSELADIVHFAEAGPLDEDADVDIAFVEGSVSTPEDGARLQRIRDHSRRLVSIGACATSGGIQALRNMGTGGEWPAAVYAHPEYIRSLDHSTAIADHVAVDLALWGCPVDSRQLLATLRDLLSGVTPAQAADSLCQDCKRRDIECVMVVAREPCLGPVTRGGCGALCPTLGRACYGCYGPAGNPNVGALAQRFTQLGLNAEQVRRRFRFIHSDAAAFRDAGSEGSDKA